MKHGSVKDTKTGEIVIFENVNKLGKFKDPVFSICKCGKPRIPHGHIHEKQDFEKRGQKVFVLEKVRGIKTPDCLLRLGVVNSEQVSQIKSSIMASNLKDSLSPGDIDDIVNSFRSLVN